MKSAPPPDLLRRLPPHADYVIARWKGGQLHREDHGWDILSKQVAASRNTRRQAFREGLDSRPRPRCQTSKLERRLEPRTGWRTVAVGDWCPTRASALCSAANLRSASINPREIDYLDEPLPFFCHDSSAMSVLSDADGRRMEQMGSYRVERIAAGRDTIAGSTGQRRIGFPRRWRNQGVRGRARVTWRFGKAIDGDESSGDLLVERFGDPVERTYAAAIPSPEGSKRGAQAVEAMLKRAAQADSSPCCRPVTHRDGAISTEADAAWLGVAWERASVEGDAILVEPLMCGIGQCHICASDASYFCRSGNPVGVGFLDPARDRRNGRQLVTA